MEKTIQKSSFDFYDEFLAKTAVDRLQKILSRYEMLKMTTEIPGDIVECGVFKGSGIYTLAKLLRLLMQNQGKKIIGFDFFEAPRSVRLRDKQDKKCLDCHAARLSSRETILKNLRNLELPAAELIVGDVAKTTKKYCEKNLGFRISFLYLDVDNYEGTLAVLRNLFPRVTRGGLIVFDEYAKEGYGESDAVEDYFKKLPVKIRALPIANTPSAYIVKD